MDIDIFVALYALVAKNPQLGDFIGDRLGSGEKCENKLQLSGWSTGLQ